MHLVEIRKETNNFPNVLASPSSGDCRKSVNDIGKDEILDFTQYCLDNKVVLNRKKYPPFYATHKSYELYLRKQEKLRNKEDVRTNLIAEYGEIRSFLTDKYPECRPQVFKKKIEEEENNPE